MSDTVQSLTLEARPESLQSALAFVREGANEASLPEDRAGQIEVIVEEILMNVSRYAYPQGAAGELTVKYWVPERGELRLEVADQGREFDPLAAEPPDFPPDLMGRSIGGLGLLLIRSFADSLSYRRDHGWNRLTIAISSG